MRDLLREVMGEEGSSLEDALVFAVRKLLQP
jgi:hypothetical protein